MERLRPIIRSLSVIGVGLGAALGLGCVSTGKITQSLKQTVASPASIIESTPAPASQVLCFWQRRLTRLPDPTREGTQTIGLPGQLFLITPDSKSAEVNGDLAIAVYDETVRQPGVPAKKPEVWHFTKETLKRLSTTDERFGRSYALFLPWPETWNDVAIVKIMVRYQSPGQPDLYGGDVKIALDFSNESGPVWSDVPGGNQQGPNPGNPGAIGTTLADHRSVPDPQKLMREMNQAGATQPQAGVLPPAGMNPPTGFPPPAPVSAPPMSASPMLSGVPMLPPAPPSAAMQPAMAPRQPAFPTLPNTQPQTATPPAGAVQPIIIPRS